MFTPGSERLPALRALPNLAHRLMVRPVRVLRGNTSFANKTFPIHLVFIYESISICLGCLTCVTWVDI